MTDEIQKLKKRDIRKKKSARWSNAMKEKKGNEKQNGKQNWSNVHSLLLNQDIHVHLNSELLYCKQVTRAVPLVRYVSSSSQLVVIGLQPLPHSIIGFLKICVRAGGSKPAAPHQVLYSLGVLPTTVHVGPWGQSLAEGWKCTVVLVTSLPQFDPESQGLRPS